MQDGVAPQCPVKGLDESNRAYIPTDGSVPRGYDNSHYIKNYGWIFNRTINEAGYVKKR